MRDRDVPQPSARRQFKYIRRQLRIFRRHHVSTLQQGLILIAACTIVLYSVFFTNVLAIHDFFHELRHALGIIPCH
ncbi:CbtB-domain containing protein [Candidatus Entotheonella palauensis]|uniref:CbtB-domain containing protein n=1 Tax=Candidatus Entotheonella palauensis TaxID=93172 RepID=UPI000B7CDA36|nr:CbtB-domain containing protein [Candidatus Entotheonella palauensis]